MPGRYVGDNSVKTFNCFIEGTVVCELQQTDKYEAIHELIEKAPVFQTEINRQSLEEAVVLREKQQSTGFGHGVAVAHGKLHNLDTIRIALGISKKGIEFESIDGEPVQLLFIVASPPKMEIEYLLALSVLTGLVRNKNFRDEILSYRDSGEIERRLCDAFHRNLQFRANLALSRVAC